MEENETSIHQMQKELIEKSQQIKEKDAVIKISQLKLKRYNSEFDQLIREIDHLRKQKKTTLEDEKSNDIVELKVDLFKEKQKNDELKQQFKEIESENQILREKLTIVQNQIENFENLKIEHSTSISQQKIRIIDLELKLSSWDQKNQLWQNFKENCNQEILQKDDVILKQSQDINNLKIALEEGLNKNPDFEIQINRLLRQKDAIQVENSDLKNKISSLYEDIQVLSDKLTKSEAEISELKSTDVEILRNRLYDQTAQIIDMVTLSNKRQSCIDDLTLELEKLLADHRQLEFQIVARDRKIELLKNSAQTISDNRNLTIQRSRNKHQIPTDSFNTIEELKLIYGKIDALTEKLNQLSQTNVVSEVENKLRQELNTKHLEISAKEDIIDNLNRKLEQNILEIGRNEIQRQSLEEKIAENQSEIARLNLKNGETLFFNKDLTKQVESFKAFNLETSLKLKDSLNLIENMSLEKEDLNRKYNLIEIENRLYNEKLEHLRDLLSQRDKEFVAFQNEYDELQETLIINTQEFLDKIDQLKIEREEADLKFQELNNKFLQISAEKEDQRKQMIIQKNEREDMQKFINELKGKLDEFQKLSKLSTSFIQKIQAYRSDEAALESLQSENASLMTRIILLENEINAADLGPRIDAVLDQNHFRTTVADLERSAIPRNVNIYATSQPIRVSKSGIKDLYEDRLHALRKKMDMLEAENQTLIKNLNNYIKKTKRDHQGNEPVRFKDFYTNNPQVMQNIKLELLNRGRKVESLHLTISRMAEDYRLLKSENDKLEEKLTERESQLRIAEGERISIMEKYLQVRQKEKLGEIFASNNLNESNKKILKFIEEKEENHSKLCSMYQSRINSMLETCKEHQKCDNFIKQRTNEIKILKESNEMLEHKLMVAKSSVKDSSDAYQGLQDIHKNVLKQYYEIKDSFEKVSNELLVHQKLNREFEDKALKLKSESEKQIIEIRVKNEKVSELEYMVSYLEKLIETRGSDSENIQYDNPNLVIQAKEERIYRLQQILQKHDNCSIVENKLRQQILELNVKTQAIESKLLMIEEESENQAIEYKNTRQELDRRTYDLLLAKESLTNTLEVLKKQEDTIYKSAAVNERLRLNINQITNLYSEKESEYNEIIVVLQEDFRICFERLKNLTENE
jgi:hypothetical protein